MSQAKALALPRSNPFVQAADSLKHSAKATFSAMYGTTERVNGTIAVAFLMMVLGFFMQSLTQNAALHCAGVF